MDTLGEKLREARILRGLTQSQLASGIITASMVSQIESDKTRPASKVLMQLAERLGLPVEHFLLGSAEQSEASVQMLFAEYWLSIAHYDKAFLALEEMTPPPGPSYTQQRYDLMRARVRRLLNRPEESILILDMLHEEGLRVQDDQLLFDVRKEFGYVEYAMNRLESARHFWNRALDVAELLLARFGTETASVRSEVAEIYTMMYEMDLKMDNPAAAQEALQHALDYSGGLQRFADIARIYVEDAEHALELEDVSRVAILMQKALANIGWCRIIAQADRVRALAQPSEEAVGDDGHLLPMVNTNPLEFVETEILRITQLASQALYDHGERRIHRCLEIIQDYCDESPGLVTTVTPIRMRLVSLLAQSQQARNQPLMALQTLSEWKDLAADQHWEESIEVQALAVRLYAETGQTDEALKHAAALEDLLSNAEGPSCTSEVP